MALHRVTDDFIAHLSALGDDADLDETTEFLVIAATLLDLKAARLLPDAEVEDAEDLALLEARDLLFARLLQYRAYKQVAGLFVELEAGAARRFPRSVALEERFAVLLPEVLLGRRPGHVRRSGRRGVPAQAAADRRPRPPARAPVSVAEQAAMLPSASPTGLGHVRRADGRLRGRRWRWSRASSPCSTCSASRRRPGAAGGVRRADRTLDS